MFGRRGIAVLLRLPATRLPLSSSFSAQHELPIRVLSKQTARSYATPGRPRSVVGEPSTAVRRAAKRSAAKATASESKANQKNETKKKTAAKKPAAKKVAKKPVKKELTEAQKEAKTARTEKAKIAALKKAALDPPLISPANAYGQFMKERYKGKEMGTWDGIEAQRSKIGERGKETAAAWKELSVADIEHYNHLAHTAKEEAQAAYKCWVESHTPEQIHEANKARANLRRRLTVGETERKQRLSIQYRWSAIKDERAAKRPISAYLQFNINRQASGDFKNITVPERAKLIGQEWKALSEDEKRKYKNLQAEDTKRYEDEFSKVYGHPPPFNNGDQQPAMAAAAA